MLVTAMAGFKRYVANLPPCLSINTALSGAFLKGAYVPLHINLDSVLQLTFFLLELFEPCRRACRVCSVM